jgi:hypothetical protein
MRNLIFTEGTILTHQSHVGLPRDRVVELVKNRRNLPGPRYFASSVPIGDCVAKIGEWKKQGATILYLTSRRRPEEVEIIRHVLSEHSLPDGELLFRRAREEYKDVAERASPDVIIEDNCESIGGEEEMAYPHIKKELKPRIKSIVVKEFGGIDHLPGNITDLLNYH